MPTFQPASVGACRPHTSGCRPHTCRATARRKHRIAMRNGRKAGRQAPKCCLGLRRQWILHSAQATQDKPQTRPPRIWEAALRSAAAACCRQFRGPAPPSFHLLQLRSQRPTHPHRHSEQATREASRKEGRSSGEGHAWTHMWLHWQHTKKSEMPCCAPDDACRYTASLASHCICGETGSWRGYC